MAVSEGLDVGLYHLQRRVNLLFALEWRRSLGRLGSYAQKKVTLLRQVHEGQGYNPLYLAQKNRARHALRTLEPEQPFETPPRLSALGRHNAERFFVLSCDR